MTSKYITTRATWATADLADISLDPPDEEAEARTRRVLRPQIVENQKDATQPVKVTIIHQRRHSLNAPWEDVDSFNQATLKAGEEVRMVLNCHQTAKLYEALEHLHAIARTGVPQGGRTLAVTDADEATVLRGGHHRILKSMLDTEGENLWRILESLQPGLLQAAALKQQHQARVGVVQDFGWSVKNPELKEDHWQEFFEANEWILGQGVDYRYLKKLQGQPNYGGVELDGTGAPRGDYLMATKARLGFTILVEIKTPFTALLGRVRYRNKAYELGPELTGAIAQVQAQCAQWAQEGARQANNLERLMREDIYTCEPKGILIVGTTDQLADDPDKRNTFERFRRSLHNPQVLTFDELLARAELMVADTGHTGTGKAEPNQDR